MKNIILHILLVALCPLLLVAQSPDTLWTKTYGGLGREECWGGSAQQTSDGGYIIAGFSNSFSVGDFDFYVVKTDSIGDTLWTRTYGGSDDDKCAAIQETVDNGYILVGQTQSFGAGSADAYIVKTGDNGDTIWTKVLGGPNFDGASGVQQTSDGGYIIVGCTYSFGAGDCDLYLIRINSNGDTLWTKTYGGVDYDEGFEITQTPDGGCIIAAWTMSFGAGLYDAWILKIDSLGDTLWTKTYGGSSLDKACNILRTIDNNYIIIGWTYSFGSGSSDIYLIKIDTNGDTLWTKTYGNQFGDCGYTIQGTIDGGYIIVGSTQPNSVDMNMCILKTSVDGDSLWAKSIGGSAEDWGWAGQQTSDGSYMIAGNTASYGAGETDFYLLKLAPDTLAIVESRITPIEDDNCGTTIISGPLLFPEGKTCRVFDITGRVVFPDKIRPGIYFIEIDGVITKKVIKVR